MTWVLNSPDESLAFILSDNGFDVWLTNIRGTKYSREHRSLSPNDMVLLLITDMHFNVQIFSRLVD